MSKNFFLPSDYRPNIEPITLDRVSGETYWTPRRLSASLLYQASVYNYIGKLLSAKPDARCIVDVGCGPALKLMRLAKQFPDRQYVGIDQPNAIAFCQETHSFGTWISEDLAAPTEPSDVPLGDVIICADVIEHLPNPDTVLKYIKALAAPDADIIISTPDRVSLLGERARTPSNPAHIREWAFDEFHQYLCSHGVAIVKHFRTLALKPAFDRVFFRELYRQMKTGRSLRHNQVCHLRFES